MSKTITISDEKFELIKEQLEENERVDISSLQDLVGKKFYFRTVTYHQVGKVEKIIGRIVELSGASWIPDSGRFMQTIKDGELDEIEPVGMAFVNLKTVVDFFPWKHELPNKQK